MKKSMFRQRHFTLIEVLLAMAILAFSITPLLAPHLWMIQEERYFIDEIQATSIAQEYLAYFLEKLYEKQMNWKTFVSKVPLDPDFLRAHPTSKSFPFHLSYSISHKKDKPNQEGLGTYLIFFDIHLDSTHKDKKPIRYRSEIYIHQDSFVDQENKQ